MVYKVSYKGGKKTSGIMALKVALKIGKRIVSEICNRNFSMMMND
tara:strand:- start:274 stop:408 length:135 start_codon:yes stop_codon:yes gene_type:complete